MRWGRRKAHTDSVETASSVAAPKAAAKPRKVAGKTEVNDGKDVSRMSDKELRERINRINMEQQYDKLTAQPKAVHKITKGKDAVNNLMTYWNTASSLYNAYNSPMVKEIKKQFKKDEDE